MDYGPFPYKTHDALVLRADSSYLANVNVVSDLCLTALNCSTAQAFSQQLRATC